MNSKNVLKLAVKACDDMNAKDITVLDMVGLSIITDYFLICHATNERQVKAIAREIKDSFEENGVHVDFIEGFDSSRWIVIDAKDVICHVFHEEERRYYNLERLWGRSEERRVGKECSVRELWNYKKKETS